MERESKKLLLLLARESIVEALTAIPSPSLKRVQEGNYPELMGEEGAFVTLRERGYSHESPNSLRGCIGNIIGTPPLYKLIQRLARESAFHDHRFAPLKERDLPHIEIEISLLSPPKEISSPQDIVLGRDGVLLSCGAHRAVFLPQVATEQGWNLETMLEHLSIKAGLYPTGWKREECQFNVFQAEVFEEKEYEEPNEM